MAGQADILLVPDIEAGNMIAKQLTYLAGADSAGIVLGTRVPIVLTSRADNVRTRLASTAVMKLVAHDRRAEAPHLSAAESARSYTRYPRQRAIPSRDPRRVHMTTRIEKDALGEVPVPAHRLWGAQTQRSVDNFPIGVARFAFGRPVVRAFGLVKQAAARANVELGVLPRDKAELIARAAQEVIDGKWDGEFPLVVFQTGSGTQSNMNANEVIANRAIQLAGGTRRQQDAHSSQRSTSIAASRPTTRFPP